MKCSPFNIKKILDSSHSYGDQYLFDLGDEHSVFINSIEKLRNKKYKLYFLLHCFAEMAQSISESKKNIEIDGDALTEDEAASDYWKDVYGEMFNEETFADEFSDYIDSEEAAEYIYSNIDVTECEDKETLDEAFNCISNLKPIQEILDVLGREKNIKKLGIFNLKEKFYEEYGERLKQNRYSSDSHKISWVVEKCCIMILTLFFDKFDKLDGSFKAKEIINSLYRNYGNQVGDKWLEKNKSRFFEEHVQSQYESYSHEIDHADRMLGEKLFGRENEDSQRHYVDPGMSKRLKDLGEWGSVDEDGKVNFDYDERVAKIGVSDWLGVEKSYEENSYYIKKEGTFLEVIRNYCYVIKNTIDSDPDLKFVFSDERGEIEDIYRNQIQDIENNQEFLEDTLGIVDSVISGMPSNYSVKMMRDLNIEGSDSNQRIRERIRVLKEERQRQREQEEIKKQEIDRQKRIHQEIQNNISVDSNLTRQKFEELNSENAKREGIIKKPFLHQSVMRFEKYPGISPFSGQQLPNSYYSTPFHIAIYPKIQESDPDLMKNVFKSDIGLNYHGSSFNKFDHEDSNSTSPIGHYDIIGWIGGDIDLYNKIMYINEIQSDIMQNTPRMKNVDQSRINLEKESDRIKREIDQLRSSMELSYHDYYVDKIRELRKKIESSNDKNFIDKTKETISAIEKKKNENVNPYENTQKKIFNLKNSLEDIESQLEGLKESQRNPGLNREHLAPVKSLFENRFQDWIDSFYNSIFKYCNSIGIKQLFVVSAEYLRFVWSRYMGEETINLYKKVYDRQAEKFNMKKEKFNGKSWWVLDLGQNKPKFASSWYRLQKFADQDFSSIDISDLISKFTSGQIDKSQLEAQIKERYSNHVSSNAINPNRTFIVELTAFFEHFMQSLNQQDEESFRDQDSFRAIEKIKETISNFMSTTGKKYTDEIGELKEPFHSIMHRFLIQKYDYDMEMDELV